MWWRAWDSIPTVIHPRLASPPASVITWPRCRLPFPMLTRASAQEDATRHILLWYMLFRTETSPAGNSCKLYWTSG